MCVLTPCSVACGVAAVSHLRPRTLAAQKIGALIDVKVMASVILMILVLPFLAYTADDTEGLNGNTMPANTRSAHTRVAHNCRQHEPNVTLVLSSVCCPTHQPSSRWRTFTVAKMPPLLTP